LAGVFVSVIWWFLSPASLAGTVVEGDPFVSGTRESRRGPEVATPGSQAATAPGFASGWREDEISPSRP